MPTDIPIRSVVRLSELVRSGAVGARDVVIDVCRRIESSPHENVWITRITEDDLMTRADELQRRIDAGDELPLCGVPFAVKDNIDVAGLPTTAGCPEFAYVPDRHATVVSRLCDAGAILIGKTNMDQFATGLVGTRSPYGACRSVFNGDYISGGSSSGSAVAVAGGMVSFSLGTDTAGSGRVPAAFNGLVGIKPTRGRISAHGVVPACQSLDCVSIFACSAEDAQAVLAVADGFDPADPYSRSGRGRSRGLGTIFRFGVPRGDQLKFFGNETARALYEQALMRLESLGGTRVTIDYAPFSAAAGLLYGGPWVAERFAAVGRFIAEHESVVDPVVRDIIGAGTTFTAADLFAGLHELAILRRRTDPVWRDVDCLVLPTAGTIYRVDEVLADPITLNANLGYYTNFVNLLDLSAIALPAGVGAEGVPFGITLIAPAWQDEALCALARRYQGAAAESTLGPTRDEILLAVVGAHLSGMPLNHQLTSRGARRVRSCRTAPHHRLYALADSTPPKPGLVRMVDAHHGASIDVEVWAMDLRSFGAFVAEVPPPLAIGSVQLEDGSWVKGFVCEPRATIGATDITSFGGWRAYVAQRA